MDWQALCAFWLEGGVPFCPSESKWLSSYIETRCWELASLATLSSASHKLKVSTYIQSSLVKQTSSVASYPSLLQQFLPKPEGNACSMPSCSLTNFYLIMILSWRIVTQPGKTVSCKIAARTELMWPFDAHSLSLAFQSYSHPQIGIIAHTILCAYYPYIYVQTAFKGVKQTSYLVEEGIMHEPSSWLANHTWSAPLLRFHQMWCSWIHSYTWPQALECMEEIFRTSERQHLFYLLEAEP